MLFLGSLPSAREDCAPGKLEECNSFARACAATGVDAGDLSASTILSLYVELLRCNFLMLSNEAGLGGVRIFVEGIDDVSDVHKSLAQVLH